MSIDQRVDSAEDPLKRETLSTLAKALGYIFLFPTVNSIQHAYAAEKADLPKDKYDLNTVSEKNFKETIQKEEGLVWVMYKYTLPLEPMPRQMAPQYVDTKRRFGDQFWKVLKTEFSGQVPTYIQIDTEAWSKQAKRLSDETGKGVDTSFCLYENGAIVSNGDNKVCIVGPPTNADQTRTALEYIRANAQQLK
jgi:hypothetical protein